MKIFSTKIFPGLTKQSEDQVPEVVQLWSPALGFCRCYGVIPLKKCEQEPYFERCTGSYIWGLFLSLVYVFSLGMALVVLKDSLDKPATVIVESCHYVIYYIHCELTLAAFFLNSENLVGLFQQWIQTEKILARYKIHLGKSTINKCWILYSVTIVMSTMENAFYLYSTFVKVDSTDPDEMLERLAGQETNLESYFGKYKAIYSISLILVETISEVAWVTGDLIIALISILLYRYYEAFHDKLSTFKQNDRCSSDQLEELNQAQLVICLLAQRVTETFSALVFVTISCDVTYILAFLFSGLEEDLSNPSIAIRFMFIYSFGYLLLRFSLSLYFASRLTEMTHKTVGCLLDWPSFLPGLNREQQRTRLIKMDLLIEQIKSTQIGLTGGGGFFIISKSSAATLFGLIVTYEVVMLQIPRK